MRPIEYLIVVLMACYLVAPNLFWRPWIPILAAVAGVAHLILEGYRWQMVPLYALVAVLAAGCAVQLITRTTPTTRVKGRALALRAVGLVALLAFGAPPVLFPVPVLPPPGGPHHIGTLSFQWTDPARLEAYTAAPDDQRTIMTQIWYPAAPATGAKPAPWMSRLDVAGPIIARFLNLPSFFLDHVALVQTHSYADAPAEAGGAPYPVVIYSHGWNGFRTINLNQSEALASQGYIAVAVDHTYGSMVTVFADGQVALNNPAALPSRAVVGDAEYQRATQQLEATYAADLAFALDQLARVNSGEIASPLAGRLDLSRVGVYGHSTGGGATVVFCAADERCAAAFGQDPWVGPVPADVIAAGLSQPFLAMMSADWSTPENTARLDTLQAAGTGDNYRLVLAGTRHFDFTLLPLLTPLAPALGFKGPLSAERVLPITTNYLVAFFDSYLKGQGAVDLPGYPEVSFETR
ncbi:MAG: dienelactone hydrolase family protein [Anaerolineales bacterium]|nr:dienelactone hydrolase family protein [Anaerolineales bacterium]